MTFSFDALADVVRGATFDDFLLRPQFSVIERRDPSAIDLSCRFSTNITLKRPLVSANMDTVTRAPMAIVQAEEGGLGIIDRGFRNGDIEPQVREVEKVKRMQHVVIRDPYAVTPQTSLADAVAMMKRTRAGTLVVVEGPRRLKGLLTARDVRFVNTREGTVAERMTPVEQLVTGQGELTLDVAERMMVDRKVKKLPLVDKNGTLLGLITAKDITRQERLPFATRDAQGRLRVGAAIGATGDYLERAAELVGAHVDVIVIDIAHGHSVVMAKAIDAFRKQFPDVELVAGNVATADGVRFLAERGVNAIKVGIGPGGGCTTRLTTSFGVPQLQALHECGVASQQPAGERAVPLIADGGIKRHGAILEALLFGGDTVMLGSMFAGTEETSRRSAIASTSKTTKSSIWNRSAPRARKSACRRADRSVRSSRTSSSISARRSATAAPGACPSCRRCSVTIRCVTWSNCRRQRRGKVTKGSRL
jgi:IMP dehydrogenase